MHHCIATFSREVARGDFYAYAVQHDQERATLGLRRYGDSWRLAELRGVRNAQVSSSMREHITQWLKQATRPPKPSPIWEAPAVLNPESDWVDDSEYAQLAMASVAEGDPF